MSNKEDQDKRMNHSVRKYITYPLRGYTSAKAREAIKRLQKVGFDPDLAFSMVEASLPENEFYDIPKESDDE